MNISDEAGLLSEKYLLVGIQEGKQKGKYYYPDGKRYDAAIIPELEKELEDLNNEWQDYRQSRVNHGFRFVEDKLENWPPQLKPRRLILEATIDVRIEELTLIEKELLIYADKKEEDRSKMVLQYGCRQVSKVNGPHGSVSIIDGQRCSIIKGRPVIDDTLSPYNGMAVVDYREFVCTAFRAKQKIRNAERLVHFQEKAKEENLPIPNSLPVSGPRRVAKSELPKWPEGVKNYKDKGVENEP